MNSRENIHVFKKWWLSVLVVTTLGMAVVIGTNRFIDAYGIFRTDYSRQFHEPNQQVAKINFLVKNPKKYDSFVFGSSRALFIDNRKITNGTYYNMACSEAVPEEHLKNIKFLLNNNVTIRNLVIGLDDFSYEVDPHKHDNDLLRQLHPAITGKDLEIFYAQYFLKTNRLFSTVKAYITHNYLNRGSLKENGVFFDIGNTGRMLVKAWEEKISKDPGKHVKDKKFEKPTHYDGDFLNNTLSSIQEITALSKKNGINLVFFINPVHKTTYLDADKSRFIKFKRELAGLTSYYDFSGLNSITTNNLYYHETSHYREMVGDMMLRKMFGYPTVTVPQDFGVLVTPRNIDDHLARLRQEIFSFKKSQAPATAPNFQNVLDGPVLKNE